MTDPKKNLEQLGLEPGMSVADIGVGSGFYTIEAAKMIGKDGKVFAIDVQKHILEKVKKVAQDESIEERVDVIWGNVEVENGTRLRDESIDVVMISNTLFQIDDKTGLAKEVARITRPGARLLVVDWTDSYGGIGPQKEQVVDKAKAVEIFELAGFSQPRDIDTGEHHYGFVMKKS